MATKVVSITYQLKRGLQSVIEAKNPILAEGEPIVVFCDDGSTKIKIGGGKTPYMNLDYIGGTVTQDSDGEIVSIEVDADLSLYSTNPVQNKVITAALNDKVNKIEGKGLSTNDFSDNEKAKLASVENGANKTVIDNRLDINSVNAIQNAAVAQMFNTFENKLNNLVFDGGEIV
jgi:hypothetical protein